MASKNIDANYGGAMDLDQSGVGGVLRRTAAAVGIGGVGQLTQSTNRSEQLEAAGTATAGGLSPLRSNRTNTVFNNF